MKKCNHCNQLLEDDANFAPYVGTKLKKQIQKMKKAVK